MVLSGHFSLLELRWKIIIDNIMHTLHKKILGFTLTELVITMTIVAITSTLATVYFFQSFSDSRDAGRVTDIDVISKNLDIFYTKRNIYPQPDAPRDVTYSGEVAWTQ
jgi:prepilin-type N-terminal cleavage/methylation domain-containing protein